MIEYPDLEAARIGQANIWRDGSLYEVLVYDGAKILKILMERDGNEYHDALDYIYQNIEHAYLGVHTPIVVWPE